MTFAKRHLIPGVIIAAVLAHATVQAQPLPYTEELIERYSYIQMHVAAPDRDKSMTTLLRDSVSYRDAHPDNAEAWITTGRIRAGYAASQGTASMLALLKDAKADMEKALSINPAAQEGRAQAFLGMLYMLLPGWPLSFGDEKKAALLMDGAMKINATNATNCYYYARYLVEKKQYQKAREYLLKASAAVNADLAHPHWQEFQKKNIADTLQTISRK